MLEQQDAVLKAELTECTRTTVARGREDKSKADDDAAAVFNMGEQLNSEITSMYDISDEWGHQSEAHNHTGESNMLKLF